MNKQMTNKRFKIKQSHISGISCIFDEEKEYTFVSLGDDKNHMFCKALNEQQEKIQDYKRQIDELDGLLNKYSITFEELEEILEEKKYGW